MIRIPQTQDFENDTAVVTRTFFKKFGLASLLKASNAYKSRGIAVVLVFQKLFDLAFRGRSLFMELASERGSAKRMGKDTCYRFVNSWYINWVRFTSLLASSVINRFLDGLTDPDRIKAFIIDDSLYDRNRSKKAELLAKVYDHVKHRYLFGFRLLTLGWSDGNTFIPVNSSLLSSTTTKNRAQEQRDIDKRTNGFSRRNLAQTKATSVMLTLLDEAVKNGVRATHVLFDSWFCSPSSLLALKSRGLSVVAMTKKSSKLRYRYNGVMMPVKEIYSMNRKRRGRSKYLLSVNIEVCSGDNEGHAIPAKLVYVRNRNKPKDYLVLISTDVTLTEEGIIQLYGRRWDIEVFFKMSKTYLRLTKECHSLSYDAMTAYTAIVFARYVMLAVENRHEIDGRTFGELYYEISDGLSDIPFAAALQLLMDMFRATLTEVTGLSEKKIDAMLEKFMEALPLLIKSKLEKCA